MTLFEKQFSDNLCHNWIRSNFACNRLICKPISFIGKHLGYNSDCRLVGACWSSYKFFRKRETRHSEKLNEAYTELKKLKIFEDEKFHVSLGIINRKIEDIQYLQQAILHLRSYKETYKLWNDLERLETEINESLEEIEPMLREIIRERSSEPQNYPNHIAVFEKPNTVLKNIDCYNMTLMINDVVQYLYKDEPDGMLLKDYLYLEKNMGNLFVLTAQNQDFIIESKKESDSKRDKLINFLNSIIEDQILKQKFDDLRALRTDIDKKLKSFSLQIRELSENIDLGHMIKGKCKLGY